MAFSNQHARNSIYQTISTAPAPLPSAGGGVGVGDEGGIGEGREGIQTNSYSIIGQTKKNDDLEKTLALSVSEVFEESPMTVQTLIDTINKKAGLAVHVMLGKWAFAFGVANFLFGMYVFAAYPQYFWILYIVEALYFFPFRFYIDWTATPKKIFYALDYCWIMNLAIFIWFVMVLILVVSNSNPNLELEAVVISHLIFGTACGPLLAASVVLPLPLIFHNHDIMSSIFIHFFPGTLVYIFRWRYNELLDLDLDVEQIEEDFRTSFWPSSQVPFTLSIFGLMVIQYMCWFVLYSIWQLLHGIEMGARQKFDTCFHANMRDGMCVVFGKYLWKRSEEESQRMIDFDDYELRDFAVYMLLHCIGVMASIITLAWGCNTFKWFHATMLIIALIIIIIRGALFYDAMVPEVYAKVVQESIESEVLNLIGKGKKEATSSVEEEKEEETELVASNV